MNSFAEILESSTVYIALLRGVNVGGKNKLPMEALRQSFAGAGCADVRTYIQSGNVVFSAVDADAAEIACRQVEAAILNRFSIKSPLVLRSAGEMAQTAAANPYLAGADSAADTDPDTASLHVVFLADAPDFSRVASLDPERSPGDSFQLIGRDLYLRLPQGAGDTKLTVPYFDAKLKTTGTQRNWRTVLALVGMAAGAGL